MAKEYTLLRRFYARIGFVFIILAGVLGGAYALTPRVVEVTLAREPQRMTYTGLASYYDYSLPGAPSYSVRNRTAASRDYRRGSFVSVTNLENGKRTCVRINDTVENFGVIIDLSSRAFIDIAELKVGIIKVELREVIACD